MVKFLLGMVAAAAGGKWLESKTGNKPLEYVSNILIFFSLYKLLKRR